MNWTDVAFIYTFISKDEIKHFRLYHLFWGCDILEFICRHQLCANIANHMWPWQTHNFPSTSLHFRRTFLACESKGRVYVFSTSILFPLHPQEKHV